MYSGAEAPGRLTRPKFPVGELFITPNALAEIGRVPPLVYLARHVAGDWGELDAEDIEANERALQQGGRLVSVYRTQSGVRFYIITEADRSRTTILLPADY